MTPSELKERLEKADGGDREIDAELWLALVPNTTRRTLHVPHWQRPYDIDETREDGRLITVPSYTTSLDAALSLVERKLPGWSWGITSPDNPEDDPALQRQHFSARVRKGGQIVRGHAATAPLALLLAMLRALSASTNEGE